VVPAWTLQLARGILALALGVIITLSLDHSPAFGFLVFGVFAALSGAILLVALMRSPYSARMRGAVLGQTVAAFVAGGFALGAPDGDTRTLALVVGIWALVAGVLEAVAGFVTRTSSPLGRDWLIAGVLTVVLGVIALLLPADFVQAYEGESGAAGTLTSSIILVGVLGAWAILVGVLQSISAVTARTARRTPASAS